MTIVNVTSTAFETQVSFNAQDAIVQNLPLVLKLAKICYRRYGCKYELDDLVGYGNVGLVMAARQYDISQAISFTDFAAKRILSHIKLGRDRMSTIHRAHYDRIRRGEMQAPRFKHESSDYVLSDALHADQRSPYATAEFKDAVETTLSQLRSQDPLMPEVAKRKWQGQTFRQISKSLHKSPENCIAKYHLALAVLKVTVPASSAVRPRSGRSALLPVRG